jgi:hypothetical protein
VLNDELGTEPSPETQALHQRIVSYRESDLEVAADERDCDVAPEER